MDALNKLPVFGSLLYTTANSAPSSLETADFYGSAQLIASSNPEASISTIRANSNYIDKRYKELLWEKRLGKKVKPEEGRSSSSSSGYPWNRSFVQEMCEEALKKNEAGRGKSLNSSISSISINTMSENPAAQTTSPFDYLGHTADANSLNSSSSESLAASPSSLTTVSPLSGSPSPPQSVSPLSLQLSSLSSSSLSLSSSSAAAGGEATADLPKISYSVSGSSNLCPDVITTCFPYVATTPSPSPPPLPSSSSSPPPLPSSSPPASPLPPSSASSQSLLSEAGLKPRFSNDSNIGQYKKSVYLYFDHGKPPCNKRTSEGISSLCNTSQQNNKYSNNGHKRKTASRSTAM